MSRSMRALMAERLPAEWVDALPPETDSAHAARGRAAHDNGAAFERWLSDQHKVLRLARRAYVRKVGAPVIVGRDGNPCGWSGRGPADYQGVLRGGIPVAIEAKSRELRLTAREIPDHQREDLEAVEAMGGLALVVIELRGVGAAFGERYVLTRAELAERWRRSKRTVTRGGVARVETSESVGAEELRGCEVGTLYLGRWC